MNPYELLIPQLLAGAAIVFFALRAVRRAHRADATHRAIYERRMADLRTTQTTRVAAQVGAGRPAMLLVTLDLEDTATLPDLGAVTQAADLLGAMLGDFEKSIGGQGLSLIGLHADPGRAVLTFTPKDPSGATERVWQLSQFLDAALDWTDRPADPPPAVVGPLPPGVSVGRVGVTLAA